MKFYKNKNFFNFLQNFRVFVSQNIDFYFFSYYIITKQ